MYFIDYLLLYVSIYFRNDKVEYIFVRYFRLRSSHFLLFK